MYFVYFLQSKSDSSVYVGYTKNIKKRLVEHNSGKVKSTKGKLPYDLIYFEAYKDKTSALKRERRIKKSYQTKREVLERIINTTAL